MKNNYKYIYFTENISTINFQVDIYNLSNWFNKPNNYDSPYKNNNKFKYLKFNKDITTIEFTDDIFPLSNWFSKPTEYPSPFINKPLENKQIIFEMDKNVYLQDEKIKINVDNLTKNKQYNLTIYLERFKFKPIYQMTNIKNGIKELVINQIDLIPNKYCLSLWTLSLQNEFEEIGIIPFQIKENEIINREIFNKIPGIPKKIIEPMVNILNNDFIKKIIELFKDSEFSLDYEERQDRGIEEETLIIKDKNIMFQLMYPFMILTNTKRHFEEFTVDLFKDPNVFIGKKFYGGEFDENFNINSNMDLEDINFSIIGRALNSSDTKQTVQKNHNVRVFPGGLDGQASITIPFNQIINISKNKEIQQIEQVASFLFIGGFLINDFHRIVQSLALPQQLEKYKNTDGYIVITADTNGNYIREYNKNDELFNIFYHTDTNDYSKHNFVSIIRDEDYYYSFDNLKKSTTNGWINVSDIYFSKDFDTNSLKFADGQNDIESHYKLDRNSSNSEMLRFTYTMDYSKPEELSLEEIWKKFDFDSVFQEYWRNISTLYTPNSIQVFKNQVNQILLEEGTIKKYICCI